MPDTNWEHGMIDRLGKLAYDEALKWLAFDAAKCRWEEQTEVVRSYWRIIAGDVVEGFVDHTSP